MEQRGEERAKAVGKGTVCSTGLIAQGDNTAVFKNNCFCSLSTATVKKVNFLKIVSFIGYSSDYLSL